MRHSHASTTTVAVACDPDWPASRDSARALGRHLGLPVRGLPDAPRLAPELLLVVTPKRLELREPGRTPSRPICVDFVGGPTGYRRVSGPGRNQLIGRAVGLKSGTGTVLDATAGLCRDSFLLACLGCRVTAVERSSVLCALVDDGLTRARHTDDDRLNPVIQRIDLIHADARDFLTDLSTNNRPDVVYLDPMYPPAKGSAASRKEMRILRKLVGDDPDAADLLDAAQRAAKKRVVVKRHRHAPPLAADPDIEYKGRTVRYDVYLVAKK